MKYRADSKRKAMRKMAKKMTKFEYGRAYKSECGYEINVMVSRTENTVLFKPFAGRIGEPRFFRRKVKVLKLRDGSKVEYCKAQRHENGRIFASDLYDDYIDPTVEEPEVIVTEKPEEENLPYYYTEEQLIALNRAKKSSSTNASRQYIYQKLTLAT